MESQLRQQLETGIGRLGLSLSEHQLQQLLDYLGLLGKWNRAYNLTAVRDPAEMVSRHLLDSLSVVPFATGRRVIDVGTGPGLPGIPLAICYPQHAFTLLDSNGKKTRFLTQARMELGLQNVTVVNGRVEAHQPAEPYDQVISRAFSALQDMLAWTAHLCRPEGEFLAMKGLYPDDEVAALDPAFQVTASHALAVPGSEGQRHLLIIKKRA